MTLVLLLSLGSAFCSAMSTVLKHHSADAMRTSGAGGEAAPAPSTAKRAGLAGFLVTMVTSPLWLMGLVADGGGVGLQILALRHGDLSFVQPILTTSLVIALAANHITRRTRPSVTEALYAVGLLASLVGFLWISGATSPHGSAAKGAFVPALITGAITAAIVVGGLLYAPRASSGRRAARALAVGVAALYAGLAGLIKTCTRIFGEGGISAVVTSWQFYVLLVVGASGMVLMQYTFSRAPLAASLPVVASLDPLFSVAIGMFVYAERLRDNPAAILGELAFLVLLMACVAMLSRRAAEEEQFAEAVAGGDDPRDAPEAVS